MTVPVLGVVRETILAANLAELAGPIGQGGGEAFVGQIGEAAAIRIVKAAAAEPPPAKLIITRRVEAEGTLFGGKLMALAPYELASSDERVINGAAQRFPAQGCVNAVELRHKVSRRAIQ